MATQAIIDLADLCAPPKTIAIRGEQFAVPGAPTLDWQWTFDALYDAVIEAQGDQASITAFREHLVELFTLQDPAQADRAREAIGSLDLQALLLAVRGIYNAAPAPDDEVPPTKPKPRGGTRSTSRKPARSRSRSST